MDTSQSNFSIINKTKTKVPNLSYEKMRDEVLGKNYELSLVFIGEKKAKELNYSYRQKNNPTDILSFPLSKSSGEIFINTQKTKLEAKKFARTFSNFVGFLFIHGLLHLKGHRHGSTMEKEEKKIRAKFDI